MLNTEKLVAFAAITDTARATRFYGDTLGLPLRSEDDFALVFDANGTELRLQKMKVVSPPTFTVLGWQVRDLDAVIDSLTRRGVTMERYPGLEQDARGAWRSPNGTRVAWFKDPDGNLLSVAESPQSGTDAPSAPVTQG